MYWQNNQNNVTRLLQWTYWCQSTITKFFHHRREWKCSQRDFPPFRNLKLKTHATLQSSSMKHFWFRFFLLSSETKWNNARTWALSCTGLHHRWLMQWSASHWEQCPIGTKPAECFTIKWKLTALWNIFPLRFMEIKVKWEVEQHRRELAVVGSELIYSFRSFVAEERD